MAEFDVELMFLKALALGAKACSFGKGLSCMLYLSAGGQAGVEAVLKNYA